jgi:hypothetical protein
LTSEPVTYFGLWSGRDIQRVSELLSSLNVRFEVAEFDTTEEILRDWLAWDPASSRPNLGFDLWIRSADLDAVGDKIVAMFPERKFAVR